MPPDASGSSLKEGLVGARETLGELTPGKIKRNVKEMLDDKAEEEEEKEKRLKSVMEKTGYNKLYEAGKAKKLLHVKSKDEKDAKERWGYGSESHLRSWIEQNVKGPNMKKRLLDELVTPKERAAKAEPEPQKKEPKKKDEPVPPSVVEFAKTGPLWLLDGLLAEGSLDEKEEAVVRRHLALRKYSAKYVAETLVDA